MTITDSKMMKIANMKAIANFSIFLTHPRGMYTAPIIRALVKLLILIPATCYRMEIILC
jgi:hypothetical protein